MQVNSINNYNYKKSNHVNFGSVIPFRVKLNNVTFDQNANNQDIIKSISYQLARLISGTTELGAKIRSQFQTVDRFFDGNFRTIRKGHMEERFNKKTQRYEIKPHVDERFFATGADAISVNTTGRKIGTSNGSDASKTVNLENETDLCSDMKNRINGLKEIIVNAKSYIIKKGTPEQTTKYKVTGVEFVKETQAAAPKKRTVPKLPELLTEDTTRLAKAGKRAKKKARYNPNQGIFSFIPEIEKAQESKEIKEEIAKMWANH